MTIADFEKECGKLGLPPEWHKERDRARRSGYFTAFGDLQRKVWEDHVRTLSHEERLAIVERRHPSQHHSMAEQANTYAKMLQDKIENLSWVSKVSVGFDQCDLLCLLVHMRADPGRETMMNSLPLHFRGFKVKVITERKGEPAHAA